MRSASSLRAVSMRIGTVQPSLGAEIAAEDETVGPGQHQIEHDQVDGAGRERGVHLPPVGGGRDAEAVLGEIGRDELAELAVVVDEQARGRRGPSCGPLKQVSRAGRRTRFVSECIQAGRGHRAVRNSRAPDISEIHGGGTCLAPCATDDRSASS